MGCRPIAAPRNQIVRSSSDHVCRARSVHVEWSMNVPIKLVGVLGLVMGLTVACGGSSDTDPNGSGGSGGKADSGVGAASGAGGTAGAAGSAGASGTLTWQECFGDDGQDVKWALNLCTGAGCAMAEHVLDCCGTVQLVGVEASKQKDFDACEAAWRKTLPDCQCAAGPLQIQQPAGGEVSSKSEADVDCVNWASGGGVCKTLFK